MNLFSMLRQWGSKLRGIYTTGIAWTDLEEAILKEEIFKSVFLIQESLKGQCYLIVCTFIFLRTVKNSIPIRKNLLLKYSA